MYLKNKKDNKKKFITTYISIIVIDWLIKSEDLIIYTENFMSCKSEGIPR